MTKKQLKKDIKIALNDHEWYFKGFAFDDETTEGYLAKLLVQVYQYL